MKKNILIIALLGLNIVSAQFAIDFESLMEQNITPNTDLIIPYRDLNPVTDGINTSETAVKVMELEGCDYWGSIIIDKFRQTISLEDGKYFSIDFLSPKSNGMITLKLKNGAEEDFIYSGKGNTWRTAVFKFSGIPKSTSSTKINIFFDVRDRTNPTEFSPKNQFEEVYWFDNLVQSKTKIRPKK